MTLSATSPDGTSRLGAYALFGGVLSAAGLPLYIHAPKFFVDTYGVPLAALGAVLGGLRLLDIVQDPAFGWLARRFEAYRALTVLIAGLVLGGSMVGLFAITPPVAPLLWFGLMLTGVFSGFSFLTIVFYAQGVSTAGLLGSGGHLRLARWRETGALLGVCLAAVAPTLLAFAYSAPFAVFSVLFLGLVVCALLAMGPEWSGASQERPSHFGTILRDTKARRLLLIALVNAAPVAVSSTVFLFFVESRLAAPGAEGPLLLVFFLCAAVSAPVWSKLAERYGVRPVLLSAMIVAILSFAFVFALGPGDAVFFGIICAVSGMALGADMTLLPAAFARRLEVISPGATEGFGLWAFVSKLTLALAAVGLLPALETVGFASGQQNTTYALNALTFAYAGVPILLKLVAMGLLVATPLAEEDPWKQ